MTNDRTFTLQDMALAHRVMNLPEPLLWVHRDHGVVVGLIEGWIHDGIAEVDHMVLLPLAQQKLTTMMTMSRDATRACHERGLDVVVKIRANDPRYSGLEAWAKRQNFFWYAEDALFDYFINRKETPDGKVQAAPAPEAACCA